jgi:hypothetical protein
MATKKAKKARKSSGKKARTKKTPAKNTVSTKKRKKGANDAALPKADARAALDHATQTIGKLHKNVAKTFWAIGRRLLQVSELGLHRARGYDSIEAYIEASLPISAWSAFQYMRVADAFSEEVAMTFGPEKLDRALAYIALTPEEETPADIPTMRVRVPGDDGEPVRTKPFAESSVADLRRATEHERGVVRKEKKPAKLDLPQEVVTRVNKAERAFERSVGKNAGGAEITTRKRGGAVVLDLRAVPIDRAPKVLRSVADALG